MENLFLKQQSIRKLLSLTVLLDMFLVLLEGKTKDFVLKRIIKYSIILKRKDDICHRIFLHSLCR